MKKMLLPLSLLLLLATSCEKESLRPDDSRPEGVTTEMLQASPKELKEARMREANLTKTGGVVYTPEKNKPAPGLQPIDWKIAYKGGETLKDLELAHTLLVEYIMDLQDFLEEYPAEKYYFLGVHKEFITKLQLSLGLKAELETGIQQLINADLERARFNLLQKAFADMDRDLEEKGMTFKQTDGSLEPVITIGNSRSKAKKLAEELKLYISDGEELLAEANSEYSILETAKVEVAKAVLEEINNRI